MKGVTYLLTISSVMLLGCGLENWWPYLPHPSQVCFFYHTQIHLHFPTPPCFDYYWKSRNQPLGKNSRSRLHFPNCTDDLKSEFSYTSTHFMVLIRKTSADNVDIRLMLWCKLKTSVNPGRIWFIYFEATEPWAHCIDFILDNFFSVVFFTISNCESQKHLRFL